MAIESSPFEKLQQAAKPPAERIVDTAPQGSEDGELSLRPKRLSEYIGQNKMKEQLSISLTAAKMRGEALDHLLLHGPPGLGKTSLAHVIALEMGANLRATSGPAIERPGDLVAILSNLEDGAVLFIDEIHRLNRLAEEFLYPAMEDFEMDMTIGQGPSARTVKIPLAKFTLIGATTRPGLLTNPLRDRFGIVQGFEFYEEADLTQILIRSADILGVGIDERGAGEIASRSRGTPRIANRLLKRARDYAQVKANGIISHEVADAALKMMEVDRVGLDSLDRLYLTTLIDRFDGGPTGAETMAATLRLERDTIEDVLEPFLMMAGFLQRTPRGRTATRRAYEHLGRRIPKSRSSDTQPGLLELES